MERDEFEAAVLALGGLRPAARVVGVTPVTLRDYRRGKREVSRIVAAALRAALRARDEP